jgi:hypothetical protein
MNFVYIFRIVSFNKSWVLSMGKKQNKKPPFNLTRQNWQVIKVSAVVSFFVALSTYSIIYGFHTY